MKISSFIAPVVALSLLGSSAFANPITVLQGGDVSSTYTTFTFDQFNNAGTTYGFDTTGAILTGITLTITGVDHGFMGVTNNATNPGTLDSATDYLHISYTAEVKSADTAPEQNLSITPGVGTTVNLGETVKFNLTGNNDLTATPYTDNFTGRFAFYIGNGTVGFKIKNTPSFNLAGAGLGSVGLDNQVLTATQVSLQYDYSPSSDTPEPGTMIMSMIPILGIVTIGLRRRQTLAMAVKNWFASRR